MNVNNKEQILDARSFPQGDKLVAAFGNWRNVPTEELKEAVEQQLRIGNFYFDQALNACPIQIKATSSTITVIQDEKTRTRNFRSLCSNRTNRLVVADYIIAQASEQFAEMQNAKLKQEKNLKVKLCA